jgi:small neutral amino acid transporter SnatA (MarC family)
MELTNVSLIIALLTLLNPLIIGLIYLNFKPKASFRQSVADGITVCLGSTLIMLVIIGIGTKILDFLGVNLLSIRIAGGIILTLSVYQLMTRSDESKHEDNTSTPSKQSVITPFVTPICVGGASISLLFTYIAAIPALTLPVFINLGSSVFLVFLIIGAFLPLSVIFFKKVDESILSAIKSISLFIVFSIGISILISAVPEVLHQTTPTLADMP